MTDQNSVDLVAAYAAQEMNISLICQHWWFLSDLFLIKDLIFVLSPVKETYQKGARTVVKEKAVGYVELAPNDKSD